MGPVGEPDRANKAMTLDQFAEFIFYIAIGLIPMVIAFWGKP